MVAQYFLLAAKITLRTLQTDSTVVSKQYDNVLKLLLKLQQNFCADRDESLDISAPLEFAGDSVSTSQLKITSSGMEQLLNGIDVDYFDLTAQIDYQKMELEISASGAL